MHGGAAGSGGPKGARNGNYKHGRYTAETIATRRWLREKIREVRALTRRFETVIAMPEPTFTAEPLRAGLAGDDLRQTPVLTPARQSQP